MASLKPLVMRANRLLGAKLVESGLVSIDDLDAANERLLELMSSSKDGQQVSLLSILLKEKRFLSEDVLLEHLVEEQGLALIDITILDLPDDLRESLDPAECWATWTVPFDRVEDTTYLASAYYLSPVVQKYWQDKFSGRLVWYASAQHAIVEFLDGIETQRASTGMAASR